METIKTNSNQLDLTLKITKNKIPRYIEIKIDGIDEGNDNPHQIEIEQDCYTDLEYLDVDEVKSHNITTVDEFVDYEVEKFAQDFKQDLFDCVNEVLYNTDNLNKDINILNLNEIISDIVSEMSLHLSDSIESYYKDGKYSFLN